MLCGTLYFLSETLWNSILITIALLYTLFIFLKMKYYTIILPLFFAKSFSKTFAGSLNLFVNIIAAMIYGL